MIISKFFVSTASCMFVINATRNGCRLVALYFGAINLVFNTWVFLGFYSYDIWAEVNKSCGNADLDALVAVAQQSVGGQREVVVGNDLVLEAEVRQSDQVVVGDLPACARLEVHYLAEVASVHRRSVHLRDHVIHVPANQPISQLVSLPKVPRLHRRALHLRHHVVTCSLVGGVA